VADKQIDRATPIDRIEVEGEEALIFIVNSRRYYAEEVHKLEQRYVILPEHWIPHVDLLKNWGDVQWTSNSCVIPVLEAAEWWQSLEAFAVLGMSIIGGLYGVENIYPTVERVRSIISNHGLQGNIALPTDLFNEILENPEDLVRCPLRKSRLDSNVAELPARKRETVWQAQ